MNEEDFMLKNELISFIKKQYNCQQDFPWRKYPHYTVFRHLENKKWFGVIMDVKRQKLGLSNDDTKEDILVIKLKPELVDLLKNTNGFLPAYHLNKQHWISIILAEHSIEDIADLIDESYQLTN